MKRICLKAAVLGVLVSFSSVAQTQIQLDPNLALLSGNLMLTNGYIIQRPASTNELGRAVFSFVLTNSGQYAVQALVEAPEGQANAFSVNMDADPTDSNMIWDVRQSKGFQNQFVTGRPAGGNSGIGLQRSFPLSAGAHQLILITRTPNIRLAGITLYQRTLAPPGGLKAFDSAEASSPTRPAPPSNLRVVGIEP